MVFLSKSSTIRQHLHFVMLVCMRNIRHCVLVSLVGDWWAGYGYEIPTLQRYALRILSQPCSSHWCCWNWSTFESIHAKKHSRTEPEKFDDLVFVHCNLWLQSISQNRDAKCKPIVFDEIDVSSEWPTELESPAPILDDSLLDSLPLNVEVVSEL